MTLDYLARIDLVLQISQVISNHLTFLFYSRIIPQLLEARQIHKTTIPPIKSRNYQARNTQAFENPSRSGQISITIHTVRKAVT